jgi:drug/metabolite transporter (DMT)-like permease
VADAPGAARTQAGHDPVEAGRASASHRAAVLTALLVTVLWSSSWVLIRWGIDGQDLAPLTFAGLRYALGAVVLVAWLLARRDTAIRALSGGTRTVAWLAVYGVLLITVTQGAQFVALANQPAATTSLVLGLSPLLVALSAAVWLGESPTVRQAAGVALVALGTALFAAGELWATVDGMVAAIIGLVAVTASSVLGRDINRDARLSPAVVTAVSMAVGATVLLVTGLLLEGVPVLTPVAWLLIGWLAVVNTAFAFTLWNRSLQRLTAVESAAINNTMLIQVAVLAWIFLGEWPGTVGLAGIAIVIVGVLLVQQRRQEEGVVDSA